MWFDRVFGHQEHSNPAPRFAEDDFAAVEVFSQQHVDGRKMLHAQSPLFATHMRVDPAN
jgi:hypothetical protein